MMATRGTRMVVAVAYVAIFIVLEVAAIIKWG